MGGILAEDAAGQRHRFPQGDHMAQGTDRGNNGDYSCEVLSLIVLFVLSALSHFWYVLMAVGVGISLWLGVLLLGRFLVFATRTFPRREKCPSTTVRGPSAAERHSPQWYPEVPAAYAEELPAPSSAGVPAAACHGTATLCKEDASRNQGF